MKLTNKLALLIAVLSLSACANGVQQETLANGDIYELATLSNLESEASVQRIYRGNQVIAQEAIFDDSVGGDVVRTAIPTAINQGIARNTAITVQGLKNDAPAGSPAVVNNVQGAQAVANAEQTATAGASQVGPCGLPVCPQLGSLN